METINFALFFQNLIVYLLVWVFAVTMQSALTAWLSNRFGDETAKDAGRISLSPFVQADLVGTVIFPAIGFLIGWMGAGIPFIGWGRQVPLNPENWRRPKLAGVVVTLGATFASLLIAVVSFVALKALLASGVVDLREFVAVITNKTAGANLSWLAPLEVILWYGLAVNLVLALFSLIPFPPFGGGVALMSLLPESFKPLKDFLNQFGLIAGLILVYFFGAKYVLMPMLNLVLSALLNAHLTN